METSVRILRVFLNRWLDRAEADTDRTLRKLAEFGYFFSISSAQKRFFSEVKQLLSDSGSKYYMLARNLFERVDKNRTIEFGLAFGYYGLAKHFGDHLLIREKTDIMVGILPDNRSIGTATAFSDRFSEFSKGGASSFVIFCDALDLPTCGLFPIIENNPHKSFFLFTGAETTALQFAQKNVMPILNVTSDNFAALSDKLIKRQRLFGGFIRYDDRNANVIISKSFLNNIYEQGCLFLFLIEEKSCSEATHDRINQFAYQQKRKPTHPIFITELFGDLKWLNENGGRLAGARQ